MHQISVLSFVASVAAVIAIPPAAYISPTPYVEPAPAEYYYQPAPAKYAYAAPAKYAYAAPAKYAYSAAPAKYAYAAPAKLAYTAPTYAHKAVNYEPEEYDPNPSYSYAYDVQDHATGDSKSQHESRQGDHVQGEYSLIEPDGSKRIVEYTADPHNGFNAVVHKEPNTYKTVPQPAAPLIKYAPAPAYAKVAPSYAYSHAAEPVYTYSH